MRCSLNSLYFLETRWLRHGLAFFKSGLRCSLMSNSGNRSGYYENHSSVVGGVSRAIMHGSKFNCQQPPEWIFLINENKIMASYKHIFEGATTLSLRSLSWLPQLIASDSVFNSVLDQYINRAAIIKRKSFTWRTKGLAPQANKYKSCT